MKVLILSVFFLLFLCQDCFAEIKQYTNDFDNSVVTYSYFDKGLNENAPIEIVLRKEQLKAETKYTVFLSKRYAPARKYVDLENIKFKIDGDSSNVLDIDTRMVLSPVGTTYSLDVTRFAKVIGDAKSIMMQIPSYTKEKQQIRYLYYELDTNILKEWQELINKI